MHSLNIFYLNLQVRLIVRSIMGRGSSLCAFQVTQRKRYSPNPVASYESNPTYVALPACPSRTDHFFVFEFKFELCCLLVLLR